MITWLSLAVVAAVALKVRKTTTPVVVVRVVIDQETLCLPTEQLTVLRWVVVVLAGLQEITE